jgi:type IV secretory pathway VirB3-like protein
MLRDDPPERDLLAKADTQPKMFLFVPVELAIMLFTGIMAVGTVYHRFFGLAGAIPGIPVWIAAAALCRRDLNGIRAFWVKSRLITLFLDAYRWEGALSPSPWPRKSKTLPHAF